MLRILLATPLFMFLNLTFVGCAEADITPRPATILSRDICQCLHCDHATQTYLMTDDGQRWISEYYLGEPGEQLSIRPTQVGWKKWPTSPKILSNASSARSIEKNTVQMRYLKAATNYNIKIQKDKDQLEKE